MTYNGHNPNEDNILEIHQYIENWQLFSVEKEKSVTNSRFDLIKIKLVFLEQNSGRNIKELFDMVDMGMVSLHSNRILI